MKNIIELKNAEIFSVSGGVESDVKKKHQPAQLVVPNPINWGAIIILGTGILVVTGVAAHYHNLIKKLNIPNVDLSDTRAFATLKTYILTAQALIQTKL